MRFRIRFRTKLHSSDEPFHRNVNYFFDYSVPPDTPSAFDFRPLIYSGPPDAELNASAVETRFMRSHLLRYSNHPQGVREKSPTPFIALKPTVI